MAKYGAVLYGSTTYEASPVPAYVDAVLATSPLVYLRLGEASGTVAEDATANNRDGTITGSPTMGTAGLQVSDSDTAITFDGLNDSITFGSNAWDDLTTGTVRAWVKIASTGTERPIVQKTLAYTVFTTSTGLLSTYDWVAGAYRTSATNIADDVRHMVEFKFESGVVDGSRLLVDGVVVHTFTYTMTNQTNTLAIGVNDSAIHFLGIMDEFAVWDVIIADSVSADHYTAGTTAPASSDPKSAPDSQTLASSDTGAVTVTSTHTDAQAITSSDTATNAATSTVADAQALGSSDNASITSTTAKSAPDAQAVASTETATRATTSTTADTQGLASTDAATTAITSTTADSQALASSDTATTTAALSVSDTQDLASTDTATAAITVTATDTQGIVSVDSASVSEQGTKAATDSQAIASSDAASISEQAARSALDTGALASVDTASAASDGLATDTTIIVGTDGVTLQVSGVASDAQALGSSESVSVVVTMVVSDAQSLAGSETVGFAAAALATDTAVIVGEDSAVMLEVGGIPITSAITFAAGDQPRTYTASANAGSYVAGDAGGDGYDARDRPSTYTATDPTTTYDGSTS